MITARPRHSALVLAVIAGFTASAAMASAPVALDRRIDIDLVDAQAKGTFATFATMLDAELDLDAALAERKVSIRLQNVRAATALAALCDSIGCTWRMLAGEGSGALTKLIVHPRSAATAAATRPPLDDKLRERISLDLAGAKVEQVLNTFAHVLDAELDLDPGLVGGDVSIQLTNVSVQDALDAVLGGGWTWGIEDLPSARRLSIRPRKK